MLLAAKLIPSKSEAAVWRSRAVSWWTIAAWESAAERLPLSAFEQGYIHVKKGKKVHLKITIEA